MHGSGDNPADTQRHRARQNRGRNIALLIEIAARNELLKSQGYDAAKEFALRVDEEIARNAISPEVERA